MKVNILYIMDYEILSTTNINNILNKFSAFKGTFPSDTIIISRNNDTQAFVINTSNSNSPGEHWTALILDNKKCFFFDSFGLEILNLDILKQIKNQGISNYKYNSKQIQPISSNNCGYYCIAFIVSYMYNYTLESFLCMFSNNPSNNNVICYNFLRKYLLNKT